LNQSESAFDALRAHAVQAAGELVRAVAELAACVQVGEHEFDGGMLL